MHVLLQIINAMTYTMSENKWNIRKIERKQSSKNPLPLDFYNTSQNNVFLKKTKTKIISLKSNTCTIFASTNNFVSVYKQFPLVLSVLWYFIFAYIPPLNQLHIFLYFALPDIDYWITIVYILQRIVYTNTPRVFYSYDIMCQ